jgi:hypothetical protein
VAISLLWYNASDGSGVEGGSGSGQYIMQPFSPSAFAIGDAEVTSVRGDVFNAVRFVYAPWASVTLRLGTHAEALDVLLDIGPIDMADGMGKEARCLASAVTQAPRARRRARARKHTHCEAHDRLLR